MNKKINNFFDLKWIKILVKAYMQAKFQRPPVFISCLLVLLLWVEEPYIKKNLNKNVSRKKGREENRKKIHTW
jgi:hypothetical protein